MVSVREYFVVSSRNRKPGSDLSIGQCATKRHHSAYNPCKEKQKCIRNMLGYICGSAEDSHANYQTHDNHGTVKNAKLINPVHRLQ